jgi:membrane fusion protein (multidrug efflux system)
MSGQQEHALPEDQQAQQASAGSTQAFASSLSLTQQAAAAHKRRLRLIGGLCSSFLLAGILWLGYWFLFLRLEEYTDDAYVAGNLVRVSSLVNGSVREILVDNTQAVLAGQVLLRLDSTDASLALERARSALADTVRQTRSLMAESDRLSAVIALRQKELDKAKGDLARRAQRKTSMSVSEEELSHARDNLAIAKISLEVARQQMQVNHVLLQDKALQDQPQVLLRAQMLREAWLAFKRCEIKSPVDGYVARRSVQLGAYVTPGMALMSVAPLSEVWVDANFKEVQLTRMRIGQTAAIEADIYGRSVSYTGKVLGFSAGTGSSFSLLPPENATGNWIKVVQRVPVKISLDKSQLAEAPLLIGLSCKVDVKVDRSDGSMLSPLPLRDAAVDLEPIYRTTALEYDLSEINTEITAIIAANSG